MQVEPKARHWSVDQSLLIGAGVLLASAVVIGFLIVVKFPAERTNAALEAIREKGEPVTLAELDRWNVPTEEQQRAMTLIQDALAAYQKIDKSATVPRIVDESDWPLWPKRREALPNDLRAAVEEVLWKNTECLGILRKARALGECRLNVPEPDDDSDLKMYGLKLAGSLVALESLALADAGDGQGALRNAELGLWLADTLSMEPNLGAMGTRMWMRHTALRSVQHALSCGISKDDEPFLIALDARLADPGSEQLYPALVGERCLFIDRMKREPELNVGFLNSMDLEFGLGLFEKLLPASQLEPDRRHRVFDRLRVEEFDTEPGMVEFATRVTSHLWLQGEVRADIVADRLVAQSYVARTALAVERFRLATGELPLRLEQLVPTYVDAVAIDPFDGMPVKYVVRPDGYVVYSVGGDREDDGGSDPEAVEKKLYREQDLVFVVAR